MTGPGAEGRRLLTEDAAAVEAGVDIEAIRRWHALGYLEAVETPAGVRYPLRGIRDLLEHGLASQAAIPEHLSPQQASLILHVGTPTLGRRAREGRLARRQMPSGRYAYEGQQIRAIAAERERLRDPMWWPEPRPTD